MDNNQEQGELAKGQPRDKAKKVYTEQHKETPRSENTTNSNTPPASQRAGLAVNTLEPRAFQERERGQIREQPPFEKRANANM